MIVVYDSHFLQGRYIRKGVEFDIYFTLRMIPNIARSIFSVQQPHYDSLARTAPHHLNPPVSKSRLFLYISPMLLLLLSKLPGGEEPIRLSRCIRLQSG